VEIVIRAKNMEVTDPLRASVEEKLTRVGRLVGGMDRAEVRFFEERNPRISEREVCEMTVHGHGHIVRAKAGADDVFVAVDRAITKLEHRMATLKGRLIKRSHPRRNGSVDSLPGHIRPEDEDDIETEQDQSNIVKTKQFAIKPMTPEEASLQMELLGHDFFLFTNADTSRAAVVYRRNDGHVGLIDAS
jgi:putative sigma-54 modulation protein